MNYWANFLQVWYVRVAYMEGIKYVNLIEISPVVIEIRVVEYGKLTVPVNNTLVRHMAFLAADTRLCVLICITSLFTDNTLFLMDYEPYKFIHLYTYSLIG